jgi:phage shock protein E
MKTIIIIGIIIAATIPLYFMFLNQSKTRAILDPIKISQEISDNKAVLLDVRTDAELVKSGWAKNSIHFDIARIDNGEIPDINKNTKIYIYCRSGIRARQAKQILEDSGYQEVYSIGGLTDWKNSGGEINKE